MQKPNPLACIGTKIKNNLYNVVICYIYLTKKALTLTDKSLPSLITAMVNNMFNSSNKN